MEAFSLVVSIHLPILLREQRRSSAWAKILKRNCNCVIYVETDVPVKTFE